MALDDGTVNIHGRSYKTVAARVQEFRSEHKAKLSIVTRIVSLDTETVVVKATIKDATGFVIATGHAEERRTASQINRTSALENAETSAIGRALASFGLAGTEFASADEVANAITQQREPAPAQKVKNVMGGGDELETGSPDDPPTQAQLDRIREIRKKLGYSEATTESRIKLLKTKAQAGASVGKLKNDLARHEAAEAN